MKRYRLWFKQGSTHVEKLGDWDGVDKRNALQECLKTRGQTISQRATMLGVSGDRFVDDYVDAEEL
jgi:hypothetical protein